MRAPAVTFGLAVVMLGALPCPSAAESSTAAVTVIASFAPRTALSVSSRLLHFDVMNPSEPALASVDFSAKARTGATAEVVLSVEPVGALHGPGGAATAHSSVTFEGVGQGMVAGRLTPVTPVVAGRWTGSGARSGRVVFALRASAAGRYTLPVRFVLTAP